MRMCIQYIRCIYVIHSIHICNPFTSPSVGQLIGVSSITLESKLPPAWLEGKAAGSAKALVRKAFADPQHHSVAQDGDSSFFAAPTCWQARAAQTHTRTQRERERESQKGVGGIGSTRRHTHHSETAQSDHNTELQQHENMIVL